MKRICLFFILAFLINVQAYSQKEFSAKVRAQYISDLIKYIKWPNINDIDSFRIGIVKDSTIYSELKNLSSDISTKDNKPFSIQIYSSIDKVPQTEVLYVHKNTGVNLNDVFSIIGSNPTLLISENYEFHKSMLNFIVVGEHCRFELNQEKIDNAQLILPRLLIAQAIQTKADWETLYKKTEVLLEKEKEVVKQQNVQIEQQIVQITKQEIRIKEQTKEISIQQKKIDVQKIELSGLFKSITKKQKELEKSIETLNNQKVEIESQKESIVSQQTKLVSQTNKIKEKEKQITVQEGKLNELFAKLKLQRVILILAILLSGVFIILGYVIYRAYRIKKKSNILLIEKNEEILQQKEEITAQRDEIEVQHNILAKQKQDIMDSIHYASRIQRAVMPPQEFIDRILPENYFILNKPRDVVSGDFFWMAQHENKTVVTVADCTGHGVPGAFMSMLGITFLNEIVNKNEITSADEILNQLRNNVIHALHQKGESAESKDGMDIALCVLNLDTKTLQYSGAYNPLYLVRNNELQQFKADKMPIGVHIHEDRPFSNNEIKLQKGDSIYIFSDGYVDQFGGDKDTKFKSKPFKQLLIDIQQNTMPQQHKILDKTIEDWKGQTDQIDDILVMGIRV